MMFITINVYEINLWYWCCINNEKLFKLKLLHVYDINFCQSINYSFINVWTVVNIRNIAEIIKLVKKLKVLILLKILYTNKYIQIT